MPMLKRFVEFLKSLLILALITSAIYLTYYAWSTSIGTGGDLLAYLKGEAPKVPASYAAYEEYSSVQTLLTPLSAVVHTENGLCTVPGSDVKLLFERTRTALNDALTTASPAEQVTAADWNKARSGSMVLYDFVGEIPLDTLAILAGGSQSGFSDMTLLMLAASDDSTVTLYWQTAAKEHYRATTTADAAPLLTALLAYPADGSMFLADTAITTLPRYGATMTATPIVDVTLPTDSSRVISTVLEALGFNSYTTKAYPESDTVRVYVEELNTMRLSETSTVRYYSPASDTGVRTAPIGLRKAGLIADAYDICASAVASHLGDTQLYLIKTYTDEATGRFVVLFGIHADSIPVAIDGSYIASFEYCGQNLVTANLQLAEYRRTLSDELLLPAQQAYASVGNRGNMTLRYVSDKDGIFRLNWYLID